MGSGFSKMKKQARMMQEQYAKMQEELQSKEVTGESEGGLVSVIINGEKELKSIKINPECVDKDDVEGLQDLMVSALKDAYERLGADQPQMGMGLPF